MVLSRREAAIALEEVEAIDIRNAIVVSHVRHEGAAIGADVQHPPTRAKQVKLGEDSPDLDGGRYLATDERLRRRIDRVGSALPLRETRVVLGERLRCLPPASEHQPAAPTQNEITPGKIAAAAAAREIAEVVVRTELLQRGAAARRTRRQRFHPHDGAL